MQEYRPEYFSRFFKKYMGIFPMEYLTLIRQSPSLREEWPASPRDGVHIPR